MTEASRTPTPDAPAPRSSVVVDTNAVVKVSKRPVFIAVAVVLAFVAFTVVWFATRSSDDYQPGRVAQGFLDAIDRSGAHATPSAAELRCIDDAGQGIDASIFEADDLNLMGGATTNDPRLQEFAGKVFDDCLTKASRVALLASGLTQGGDVTGEQAECLATKWDDAFVAGGGYKKAFGAGENGLSSMMLAVFGAMGECGIDMNFGDGSTP